MTRREPLLEERLAKIRSSCCGSPMSLTLETHRQCSRKHGPSETWIDQPYRQGCRILHL